MKNTLQKFLVAILAGTKDILYNKSTQRGTEFCPVIKQNEIAEYMKKEDLKNFWLFFPLLLHGDALHSEILAGNYQRPFLFPDVFPSGAPGSTFSRCPFLFEIITSIGLLFQGAK